MVYAAPSETTHLVHRDRFNKQHVHPGSQCSILMVLLPDRVQVTEQPKANAKMSYPVNDTPSSIPIFDDTKHCSKCGVILTENHKCFKWKGRNRKAKSHQPCNNSSESQKRKLDSSNSKSKASNTKCASTQTEVITCLQTSTTQTDDIQVDRNENVTRDILEKMASSRLLLYHLQSFMADLNLQ